MGWNTWRGAWIARSKSHTRSTFLPQLCTNLVRINATGGCFNENSQFCSFAWNNTRNWTALELEGFRCCIQVGIIVLWWIKAQKLFGNFNYLFKQTRYFFLCGSKVAFLKNKITVTFENSNLKIWISSVVGIIKFQKFIDR